MDKRNATHARPVRMEQGYLTVNGTERVCHVHTYGPGEFRADIAVPSERPGYPITAADVAVGIVGTFERFTWADYRAGDVVLFEGVPAVVLEATERGALRVSTFPGMSWLIGSVHSALRHVVGDLSPVFAERVAEIRAYGAAVAR